MLGALMYASKAVMEILPNIHLLGVFIIAITVVYRKKALYPIYTYILLNGLFAGFAAWWIPYIYIWTILWGVIMLLPESLPKKWCPVIYMLICGLHGLLFGVLYAPAQAIIYGLNAQATLAWIASGLPYDLIHGISNLCCGVLICPLIAILKQSKKFTN